MRLQLIDYLTRHRGALAADTELRAAIASAPGGTVYDLFLAGNMARIGQIEAAIETVRAAVQRVPAGPSHTRAQVGLARLMMQKGDEDLARALLDRVLKDDPDNNDALVLRADILTRKGAASQAISDLLAVTARQPTNAAAFERLASAYLQQGRGEEAVAALKRVVDVNPSDLRPMQRLVNLERSLDRLPDAQSGLHAFVRRNPDSLEGRVADVRLTIESKDWTAAQAGIDGLRALPGSSEVSLALSAEVKEGLGLSAEAADYISA